MLPMKRPQKQGIRRLLTTCLWAVALTGIGCQTGLAQTSQVQVLLAFNATNGTSPRANLCLGPDGDFYGTTASGGTNGGYGTIFKVTTDGSLTSLVSFGNTNGADSQSGLVLGADGSFYGTTVDGGTNGGYGTVFKVTTNGVLTSLTSFANTNGAYPYGGLTLASNGNFYGATYLGGSNQVGTIFGVTTNGVLTSLVSFANTNGGNPHTGLAMGSDGDLYGTTTSGGTNGGYGTVFKVTTNGLLTSLMSFANTNGAYPQSILIYGNDNNFYGTTYFGGSNSLGTVFRVTTNGTLTSLASFAGANGANPVAGLMFGSDGNFYGTTYSGGSSNMGTVFKMTTNGALTSLTSFFGTNGAYPYAALTPNSDGDFYGVTASSTNGGNGAVVKFVVPPSLSAVMLANRMFQGSVHGLARPSLQIQTAVGLTGPWTTLTNLVFTNGVAPFADPSAANVPQRFYRVMVQ
jgi:uncharacterized repeat protein (TIGR03803 family)